MRIYKDDDENNFRENWATLFFVVRKLCLSVVEVFCFSTAESLSWIAPRVYGEKKRKREENVKCLARCLEKVSVLSFFCIHTPTRGTAWTERTAIKAFGPLKKNSNWSFKAAHCKPNWSLRAFYGKACKFECAFNKLLVKHTETNCKTHLKENVLFFFGFENLFAHVKLEISRVTKWRFP